jgi:hypothetical protein
LIDSDSSLRTENIFLNQRFANNIANMQIAIIAATVALLAQGHAAPLKGKASMFKPGLVMQKLTRH